MSKEPKAQKALKSTRSGGKAYPAPAARAVNAAGPPAPTDARVRVATAPAGSGKTTLLLQCVFRSTWAPSPRAPDRSFRASGLPPVSWTGRMRQDAT